MFLQVIHSGTVLNIYPFAQVGWMGATQRNVLCSLHSFSQELLNPEREHGEMFGEIVKWQDCC